MATLLLSEIFPPRIGGSGRWFWEMYSRLPRDEYVIAAGQDPRQEEFDRQHDLRVHRLPLTWSDLGLLSWSGLRGHARAFRHLRRLVKDADITRLHCGRCIPCGWLALLLKRMYGIPYICYVHGEEVNLAVADGGGGVMSSRQLRWMARKVLRGAELLIANSSNSARILLDQWQLAPERIRVLHPGVDAGRFVPAPRDSAARRRLGWGDRPVILTVGRLQERKGHDMMIRALAGIRRAAPDVLYAIVGGGDERESLEALVHRKGLQEHVQFLGEMKDHQLIECYQQCDLFVLPNRQVGEDIEGFGMVLVEAQSCGKPVIAGASGGTAEAMAIAETGFVVSCDEPGPLAAVVCELLLDPVRRKRMGIAARAWVEERFDWDAVTCRAQALFASTDEMDMDRPPAADALRSTEDDEHLKDDEARSHLVSDFAAR
jgi:phosphatidylinositol alpha-1,6-mannosyltransferase